MKPKFTTAAIRRAVPVLGPIALTLLVGCSGDPNAGGDVREVTTYPAQGRVMLPGGKPLAQGTITLIPVDEEGQVAQGAIQPDGTFLLETPGSGAGAAIGDYKIKIRTDLTRPGRRPGLAMVAIPPRYQDEDASRLTTTIKPEPNDLGPLLLK